MRWHLFLKRLNWLYDETILHFHPSLPSSLPPCCTQTCLSEEVRGERGCCPIHCCAGWWAPSLYPGHSQGGARVLGVQCNVGNTGQNIILPRRCCCHGALVSLVLGPSLGFWVPSRPSHSQPDLNLLQLGPRASTALTEPPPQLESLPPTAAGPA